MANITRQVIGYYTGRPITGMAVRLRCFSHQTKSNKNVFQGRTALNGQVSHWSLKEEEYTLQQFFRGVIESQESRWQICFDSVAYFGQANSCWSVIDINIRITKDERHHVSLLLGPNEYKSFLTLGKVDEVPLPQDLSSLDCASPMHRPTRVISRE